MYNIKMEDLTKQLTVAIEKLPTREGILVIKDLKTKDYIRLVSSFVELQSNLETTVPLVFYDLYATPDIRASEVMSRHGINKEELISAYKKIKDTKTLQEILRLHPTRRNFIHKIKDLLIHRDHIKKMIKGEPAFPLAIEMHPSLECNSRCTFCYSSGHWNYMELSERLQPLTINQWVSLVDECADNGTKKIMPTGGLEPLMAMDKFLAILNQSHNRGLDTLIFTNGIEINPDNNRLVDSLLRKGNLFVSLRGSNPETYVEVTKTSSRDFYKSINGIKYLAAEKRRRNSEANLGIAFFMTIGNYTELPDIINFARDAGVDEIGLGSDNLVSLPGFNSGSLDNLKSMLRKYVPISDGVYHDGLKITMNDTLLRLTYPRDGIPSIYENELRKPSNCQNWYIKAAINPFGFLFPCCLLAHPGITAQRNAVPFGRVTSEINLKHIIDDVQGKVLDATTCITCNPSEYNGLIALEKLKDDYNSGVDLQEQPYRIK